MLDEVMDDGRLNERTLTVFRCEIGRNVVLYSRQNARRVSDFVPSGGLDIRFGVLAVKVEPEN